MGVDVESVEATRARYASNESVIGVDTVTATGAGTATGRSRSGGRCRDGGHRRRSSRRGHGGRSSPRRHESLSRSSLLEVNCEMTRSSARPDSTTRDLKMYQLRTRRVCQFTSYATWRRSNNGADGVGSEPCERSSSAATGRQRRVVSSLYKGWCIRAVVRDDGTTQCQCDVTMSSI